MSLLSDTSISNILEKDKTLWERDTTTKNQKLLIANFEEKSLTPVGYDLRVGECYLKMNKNARENPLKINEEFQIAPNEIVAIKTEEFIGMPQSKSYSGIIVSKVSMVEDGLSHISTSLDPDWRGEMIITVTNFANRKINIKRGQPFCTMILFKNESPATRDCGKNTEKHIKFLTDRWRKIEKTPQKVIWFWIIKIFVSFTPWVILFYNYSRREVKIVEGAIFIALPTFLYLLLDKIFKTD